MIESAGEQSAYYIVLRSIRRPLFHQLADPFCKRWSDTARATRVFSLQRRNEMAELRSSGAFLSRGRQGAIAAGSCRFVKYSE